MKCKFFTAAILTCIGFHLQAQETQPSEPNGKAIINVFSNYHNNFDSESGFELERSYLGYEYKLNDALSIKSVLDIGAPSAVTDYQRLAYVKNAMLKWKKGNLTLQGGLISTTQFNLQEKAWGHRYIMKSFQDKYKFGNSADLGIAAAYRIAPWLSADAIIVNGEGYKKVQKGDGLNYGLGVTLSPVKKFQIRFYGGINEGSSASQENIVNLAAYAGYRCDRFSIGAEYNHMTNAQHVVDANRSGYSLYASLLLSPHATLYARYDDIASSNDWNIANDESAAIVGAQFKLGSHVKIAPNFRLGIPKADGADNTYGAYINCYFGL